MNTQQLLSEWTVEFKLDQEALWSGCGTEYANKPRNCLWGRGGLREDLRETRASVESSNDLIRGFPGTVQFLDDDKAGVGR